MRSGGGADRPIRISAYVLVADPNFLARSLASYYDRVDRIILSYDQSAVSWTGTPLPLDDCLALVDEIDTARKCIHAPGRYARLEHDAFENETHQRQEALDAASETADWVVQLDSDEVMASPEAFFDALIAADSAGADALDYPSRWLYARYAPGRYLEASDRWGRVAASYPGPLAVRSGTRLRHARQTDAQLYRVDMRRTNTDPWRSPSSRVDRVIAPAEAVLHFSWVRTPEFMQRKFGWSAHAEALRPPAVYRRWRWRSRHPLVAAVTSPLRSSDWYRRVSIPEPPGGPPFGVS